MRSLVYLPLKVNHELVGMFVAGKSRSASFITEDVQTLATFANQLGLLKTRTLVSEQEKRTILEERNRIAREIHDGITSIGRSDISDGVSSEEICRSTKGHAKW